MKACVAGLWHLGSVTAAALCSLGHHVSGFDEDRAVVEGLSDARPPLFEPGLAECVAAGLREQRLSFTTDPARALAGADVLWVTYDTPVDEDDIADVDAVLERVSALLPLLSHGALVIVSSQLAAGCTRRLEEAGKHLDFAYSPENLRLGKALEIFLQPERLVMGIRHERSRATISALLPTLAPRILWMSVESAEMSKHALNAFLAMSVAFANELAAVCEQVGADAKDVERALKSEQRIGPGAYVSPGAAFAGGTLARDVQYLRLLAEREHVPAALFTAIKRSNDEHRGWTLRKLEECLGPLAGRCITILGLTYKPGTDTLRRSASLELARLLLEQGAVVRAHDPRVSATAPELPRQLVVCDSAPAALEGADALVVGTPWPDYRELTAQAASAAMRGRLVIDSARHLVKQLNHASDFEYHAVGTPRGIRL